MKEKKPPSPHRLSAIFGEIDKVSKEKPITFASLVLFLGDQSHGFLTLFLILPFVLPLSIPGMSVPFGIVISTVMGAWILDRPPWLPKFLRHRPVSHSVVTKICGYGQRIFSKIEFLVRPRLEFFIDLKFVRLIIALVIIAAALFLALPLPPGTNFLPSLIIFLLSLSILERDGLIALLGISVFLFSVKLYWGIVVFLLKKAGMISYVFSISCLFS
jgi:hypothetical protein